MMFHQIAIDRAKFYLSECMYYIIWLLHCIVTVFLAHQIKYIFDRLIYNCSTKITNVYQLTKTSIYKLPYRI
jgi:hypothetical protein